MENVILCGCSSAESRIANSFAEYATVQYFGEGGLWRRGEKKKQITVYQVSQFPKTENFPAVLVLGSELKEQKNPLPPLLVPVFDSSSNRAAQILSLTGGPAISCGTSPRDTFSLASISEQKTVVSLQRSLHTLAGNEIEPRDMAFCAVMLLCDVGCEQDLKLV